MAGRPVKPRATPNRVAVLDRLRADLAVFHATAAREAAERLLGCPVARDDLRSAPSKA